MVEFYKINDYRQEKVWETSGLPGCSNSYWAGSDFLHPTHDQDESGSADWEVLFCGVLYVALRWGWIHLPLGFLSFWERPHLSHLMSFKVFLGMNLSILLSQVRLPAVPAVSYLSSQVCVWRCEDPCQEYRLVPDSREILETVFRITHNLLMDSFSGKNAYCWYYS